MATHTITSTYGFRYRFTCEHCGQTTEWLPARLQEQSQYRSGPFEGTRNLSVIQRQFEQHFISRKVPDLRKRVEAGEYNLPFGGLDGCCPVCKKQQSWEKTESLGLMVTAIVISGILTFVGWGMFNSGASSGNGHKQLAGIIIGGFFAIGVLLSVIGLIVDMQKKAAIRRDTANVTVRNKPEFDWPKKGKQQQQQQQQRTIEQPS